MTLISILPESVIASRLFLSKLFFCLAPVVEGWVSKDAHLMTDEQQAYCCIGQSFAGHSSVNHSQKEYARGNVHNNTVESFGAILERAKQGVLHFSLVSKNVTLNKPETLDIVTFCYGPRANWFLARIFNVHYR